MGYTAFVLLVMWLLYSVVGLQRQSWGLHLSESQHNLGLMHQGRFYSHWHSCEILVQLLLPGRSIGVWVSFGKAHSYALICLLLLQSWERSLDKQKQIPQPQLSCKGKSGDAHLLKEMGFGSTQKTCNPITCTRFPVDFEIYIHIPEGNIVL